MSDFKEVVVFKGGGGPGRSDFLKAVLTEAGIASVAQSDTAIAGQPFTTMQGKTASTGRTG